MPSAQAPFLNSSTQLLIPTHSGNTFFPDYQHIISTSTTPLSFPSKKELYFSLCYSTILVDHGTKSFRLDKASGKKCYTVGVRALSIAWIDDPRYWFWASDSNSRFDDVACLRHVCWFDIVGHLETRILSPYTTYEAYLVFKFGPNEYGFDDQLFKSYVTVVGQCEAGGATDQTSFNPVYFRGAGSAIRRYRLPLRILQLVREEEDVWMEIEMGEFTVGNEDEASFVHVREVEVLYTKSGIIIEGIEVRPK
ncbi:hypothetical protein QQ045_001328 [Rhodiola kirilowii]